MLNNQLQQTIARDVLRALEEDIGSGDLTALLIPATQLAEASIISREAAIVCGMPWAERCFRTQDATVNIDWLVAEGERVQPDQTLCRISGNARALLTAERCALNFLQTLSATATITRLYADAIVGTKARIYDTRKTLPGLRLAQKYAVTVGGGMNQRIGLYDGILIKENHIAAVGSIATVLQAARAINREVSTQIEVETLSQLEAALQAGAKLILLDNFNLQDLRAAVSLNAGRAILEASGGITLENVREIAHTGVDRISIGGLTKHVQAIDLSMRFSGG
ncbi:MAG: carboxylating nicotinate-nucleotide diphosphorylase [Methylophilaceae bacterium]|nr:carboxylating nicotinate-nucleotide diphosphorylase [Methylophilaceae bacterium]